MSTIWQSVCTRRTPEQTRLADQRASASFRALFTSAKEALEESGTRYLAVRTADPTPAQWTEIPEGYAKAGLNVLSGSTGT